MVSAGLFEVVGISVEVTDVDASCELDGLTVVVFSAWATGAVTIKIAKAALADNAAPEVKDLRLLETDFSKSYGDDDSVVRFDSSILQPPVLHRNSSFREPLESVELL
jgi:hypothetical protein